ncbi:MAG: DUF3794 domain-containing protein [Clostridiales bacterium]|jgi:hypothetical protein|nr:DUF3794 domain-containing protein [Clostridiales bacterium]
MAELKFGEIRNQYKKLIAVSQVMTDFTAESRDGKKIDRILSIVADPKITAADALNGEAVISGRVNYKILYINEDGEPQSLDYFSDYKDRIADAAIQPPCVLSADSAVADIAVSGGDGSSVSASVVLENSVYMIIQEVIPVLKDTPENYFAEYSRIPSQSYADIPRITVDVADESSAGVVVDKILALDASAAVLDTVAGNGAVAVKGAVYANVLYNTADGRYMSKQFEIPFGEESRMPLGLNLSAFADASVKNSKVVLSGTADDNIIRVEASVEIDTTVITDGGEEAVTDVFSVARELDVKTERFSAPRFFYSAVYAESVSESVSLEDNLPPVNELVGYLGARNHIASLSAANGRANIEGVVNLTVLYKDGEENSDINSVDVEIPYSLSVKDPEISDRYTLEGKGKVGAVTVKRKRDREIDVVAELFFGIRAYGEETVCVIADVSEGAEKAAAASAVSVYNAEEGETLWDIAKALSCTPETILEQNADLVLPVATPGRVILYRELTVEGNENS